MLYAIVNSEGIVYRIVGSREDARKVIHDNKGSWSFQIIKTMNLKCPNNYPLPIIVGMNLYSQYDNILYVTLDKPLNMVGTYHVYTYTNTDFIAGLRHEPVDDWLPHIVYSFNDIKYDIVTE